MSSVKMNATHLPLRTEFVWYLKSRWKSGLPTKLPEFHTDMEKPLHPDAPDPSRKLFLLKLQLPKVIRASN